MGTRVKAVLALAAIVAACGDSEGTSASQNPDGPDPTGGAPAAGESSTGGARPATSGGGSSTAGGRANTGGVVSTFGGFDGGNTGGASAVTGGTSAATGGAIGNGGEPTATGGASEPTDCPELGGPDPDPDDGGTYDGDLVIESHDELEALGTYSVITGNLTIGGSGTPGAETIQELDLSSAGSGGDLTIRNTRVTDLELPRLERVEGQLWVSLNLELLEVRMPELTSVLDLYLDTDAKLLRSEFPKLEEVSGTLYVHRNLKLVSWGLDALRSVGSVTITANASLPQCLVDALNENTGMMASSELIGAGSPPICDCPEQCGRIVVDCE